MGLDGLSERLRANGYFYVEKGFLKIAWPSDCYVCKKRFFAVRVTDPKVYLRVKIFPCANPHIERFSVRKRYGKIFRVRKWYGKIFRLPSWQGKVFLYTVH